MQMKKKEGKKGKRKTRKNTLFFSNMAYLSRFMLFPLSSLNTTRDNNGAFVSTVSRVYIIYTECESEWLSEIIVWYLKYL